MPTGTVRTADQFVILGIDREVFAVPVEAVMEILDMRPMFRLPEGPACLAGLIDVRGRGVPVIDLRIRLGLPPIDTTPSTRIMVLEVPLAGRSLVVGLIADRVVEVAPLDGGGIEPPPDIGDGWRSNAIRGIGHRGENFVAVFDLARLFSSDLAEYSIAA